MVLKYVLLRQESKRKQLINIYDNIVEIAGLNVVSIRNNVFDEITKFTTAV